MHTEKRLSVDAAFGSRAPQLLRLGLLLLASLAIFWSLGKSVLKPWDEAIYAQTAKEMLRNHQWLTPHFNQQPWELAR